MFGKKEQKPVLFLMLFKYCMVTSHTFGMLPFHICTFLKRGQLQLTLYNLSKYFSLNNWHLKT